MDFVSGLPRTSKGKISVWVIVDRLTKAAHFLAVKTTDTLVTLSRLYIEEIVRLHGVPLSIVSDRDLQTDGQSERGIQILEDMQRACVLDSRGSWSEALYGRPCPSPSCGSRNLRSGSGIRNY